MNKKILVGLSVCVGLVLVSACSREGSQTEAVQETTAVNEQTTTEMFREFLDENYALDMDRAPFTASYRGIKTQHDKWNSAAEAHLEETRQINEMRLLQLAIFDKKQMDKSSGLSWDLYRAQLQRSIASDEFRHHKFVIHQFRGPHTQAASNLINIHTVSDLADAQAYIGRLNNIGPWFDQVIEQMRIRREKNLLLADWQYPQMIQASKNIITGAPYDIEGGDSTLWVDFQAKVAKLDIDDQQRAELLADAKKAMVDVVKPAYLRLIAELEVQAAIAPDADGVWKFDKGDEFYAERLQWYTTTELSADEIHAIGLREVARLHEEMKAIMAEVGFEGSLAEFLVFMREDQQFYYPDTDEGRAAYLAEAVRIIDTMRTRLPEVFGILPKSELIVKRVEAFREQSAGKAFYQGPPADGSRPGIFYANLYAMADMPKYQMEALAYHEGLPGHHMQVAISTELEGVPEFQKYTTFTAYSEGWGLYTEQLGKEMGFYEDPYSNFGRLAMELWRACRLVVDTGIHAKHWTREEAIAYLVENTPNSVGDSTKAIERYIAMPGQATAYMIGKLKIIDLREKARAALGDNFDIRQFHDEVLKDGRLPLSLLEQKVDGLIEAG
ncbi:MAG: DUF885 domain-containing protein [Proteobacteria bacterium]|nr:DUF885 domain-containing protein [Pseudomonadota bacterium]